MATDGLWDFLTSKDVANVLKSSGSNLKHVANSLFSEVMNKAAEECGMSVERLMSMPPGKKRNFYDDVTLIVFDLKH
jgi:serine/threonine protein phosphatase PrpC